jgi:hypothetical protein
LQMPLTPPRRACAIKLLQSGQEVRPDLQRPTG